MRADYPICGKRMLNGSRFFEACHARKANQKSPSYACLISYLNLFSAVRLLLSLNGQVGRHTLIHPLGAAPLKGGLLLADGSLESANLPTIAKKEKHYKNKRNLRQTIKRLLITIDDTVYPCLSWRAGTFSRPVTQ